VTSRVSRPVDAVRRLSTPAKLNALGLLVTAAGMLLQIAAGSTLYPSLVGPIVLLGAAGVVVFAPGRLTPYIGLLVPLILGLGAIVAAVMTGGLIDQLADVGRMGIFVGSIAHVFGLIVAVVGGAGVVVARHGAGDLEH